MFNSTYIILPLMSEFEEFLGVFLEWGILIGSIIAIIYHATAGKAKREEEERRKAQETQRRIEEWKRKQEEEQKQRHEDRMRTDFIYRMDYERQQQRIREQKEAEARRAAEEKRLAEQKRRNELKAKFHYISLGGHNVAYRYDYYPKNRYPSVDASAEANRHAVWNFKDGASSIGVSILSDFLEGNFSESQMRSLTLCVIPASTQSKNITRYSSMCRQICEKYSLTNGFNFIQIVYDRADSREQKSSNTIANLSFSNSVYGKDIILFDDITTRGTSFVQVANELKNKGARSVYGVFIGRTVWE